MSSTPTLDARLRSAALRLRLERAVDASVLGASSGLALLGLCFLGRAVLPLYVPLAAAVLAAVIAGARAVPELRILNRLDRSHDLHDLLSSAWSLARLPAPGHSRMTQAMLARAERAAVVLDVSRAQPLRPPRRLLWLACALLFAVLAWRGARQLQPTAASGPAQPSAARPQPGERLLSEQALAVFREQLARLDPVARAEGAAAVLRSELDALLDRLAHEPMDRLAALRKLRDLEARANALAAQRGLTRPGDPGDLTDPPQQPTQADQATPTAPSSSAPKPEPKPEPEPEPALPPQTRSPGTGGPQIPQPGSPGQPGVLPPPPGGLPQPIAAAPSGPGSRDAPRGPELERRPVPDDPERARGLADAIAELRELLRREPPSGNNARGAPRSPAVSEPADDRSERPGEAAASAAAQQPSSGDAAKSQAQAPQLPAAATRIDAAQGGGPVRSQVIYGAAERGFAGRDYARVHADYEDHAERELERDQLPPGYRGYVRRYFQAIAPAPVSASRPDP